MKRRKRSIIFERVIAILLSLFLLIGLNGDQMVLRADAADPEPAEVREIYLSAGVMDAPEAISFDAGEWVGTFVSSDNGNITLSRYMGIMVVLNTAVTINGPFETGSDPIPYPGFDRICLLGNSSVTVNDGEGHTLFTITGDGSLSESIADADALFTLLMSYTEHGYTENVLSNNDFWGIVNPYTIWGENNYLSVIVGEGVELSVNESAFAGFPLTVDGTLTINSGWDEVESQPVNTDFDVDDLIIASTGKVNITSGPEIPNAIHVNHMLQVATGGEINGAGNTILEIRDGVENNDYPELYCWIDGVVTQYAWTAGSCINFNYDTENAKWILSEEGGMPPLNLRYDDQTGGLIKLTGPKADPLEAYSDSPVGDCSLDDFVPGETYTFELCPPENRRTDCTPIVEVCKFKPDSDPEILSTEDGTLALTDLRFDVTLPAEDAFCGVDVNIWWSEYDRVCSDEENYCLIVENDNNGDSSIENDSIGMFWEYNGVDSVTSEPYGYGSQRYRIQRSSLGDGQEIKFNPKAGYAVGHLSVDGNDRMIENDTYVITADDFDENGTACLYVSFDVVPTDERLEADKAAGQFFVDFRNREGGTITCSTKKSDDSDSEVLGAEYIVYGENGSGEPTEEVFVAPPASGEYWTRLLLGSDTAKISFTVTADMTHSINAVYDPVKISDKPVEDPFTQTNLYTYTIETPFTIENDNWQLAIVSADFGPRWMVNSRVHENGNIRFEPGFNISRGEDGDEWSHGAPGVGQLEVSIEPDNGYVLDKLMINDIDQASSVDANGVYTWNLVDGDNNLEIMFKIPDSEAADALGELVSTQKFLYGDWNADGNIDTEDLKLGIAQQIFFTGFMNDGRRDIRTAYPEITSYEYLLPGITIGDADTTRNISATARDGSEYTVSAYEYTFNYADNENVDRTVNVVGVAWLFEFDDATEYTTRSVEDVLMYVVDAEGNEEYFLRNGHIDSVNPVTGEQSGDGAYCAVGNFEVEFDSQRNTYVRQVGIFGNGSSLDNFLMTEDSETEMCTYQGRNENFVAYANEADSNIRSNIFGKFSFYQNDFTGMKIQGSGANGSTPAWSFATDPIWGTGDEPGTEKEAIVYFGNETVILNPVTINGEITAVNNVEKVNTAIPDNAVRIYKDGDSWKVDFYSNFYDKVEFAVTYETANGPKTEYIVVNRVGIDIATTTFTAGSQCTLMHGTEFGPAYTPTENFETVIYATYYYPEAGGTDQLVDLYATYTWRDGSVTREIIHNNSQLNLDYNHDETGNLQSGDFILYAGTREGAPQKIEVSAVVAGFENSNSFTGMKLGSGKGVCWNNNLEN